MPSAPNTHPWLGSLRSGVPPDPCRGCCSPARHGPPGPATPACWAHPDLGTTGTRSAGPGSKGGRRGGTQPARARRSGPSCRPEEPGTSPHAWVLWGRMHERCHSYAYRHGTTPIRSPACRRGPRRWAASAEPDAFHRPRFRRYQAIVSSAPYRASVVPARAAYSHCASVGRRACRPGSF